MTRSSRPIRAVVASLAVTALLGTACTGGDDNTPSGGTPPSSSGKPGPVRAAINPLRGGKPTKHGVVAVKIDDTSSGRPQRNIDKADIVYIEEVEAGLTRLLAVYSTYLPTVEAVRSTRAADPELVAQYGAVAYAASGGARNPLRGLERSRLRTTINDRGGPGFRRDGNRAAPYNLTANLYQIARALKSPRAKSIGFTWSSSAAQLKGHSVGRHVRTVVGRTPVRFDYNPKTRRYERFIAGNLQRTAAGKVISTPNVIVQFCDVTRYAADIDVNGNPNAYTHSVGKGKVAVFRDGKRVVGSWKRANRSAGTALRDAKGKAIALRPGGAWVLLVHRNAPLR